MDEQSLIDIVDAFTSDRLEILGIDGSVFAGHGFAALKQWAVVDLMVDIATYSPTIFYTLFPETWRPSRKFGRLSTFCKARATQIQDNGNLYPR